MTLIIRENHCKQVIKKLVIRLSQLIHIFVMSHERKINTRMKTRIHKNKYLHVNCPTQCITQRIKVEIKKNCKRSIT
jgi:hypothetical protein